MQNSPAPDSATTSQVAAELHDVCLSWSVYFALLAKLFGQTAIGFNVVAKFPNSVNLDDILKAGPIMRSINRDCEAFRAGMKDVGAEMDQILKTLVVNSKKSEEQNTPNG